MDSETLTSIDGEKVAGGEWCRLLGSQGSERPAWL